MVFVKRLLSSTIIAGFLISPALTPVYALDYEAKPINWLIKAPFRAVGAVSSGAVCGIFSGPVDDGFHAGKTATTHIAGAFGDEKGRVQQAVAAPVGYPLGILVGGVRGFGRGVMHGAKKGWEKPFSRWSFVTMEDK